MKTYASNIPGYCRCYRCGMLLYGDMVTVDRIKPGCEGGKYVRNNIRPACSDCNQETGSQLGVKRQRQSPPSSAGSTTGLNATQRTSKAR